MAENFESARALTLGWVSSHEAEETSLLNAGNPVSTMVTFEQFVRPALLKMRGHTEIIKPYVKAILNETVKKKPGRTQFLRIKIEQHGDQLIATSSGNQHTAMVKPCCAPTGLPFFRPTVAES